MEILCIYSDYNVRTIKLEKCTREQAIEKAKEIYHQEMFIDTVVLYDNDDKEVYRIEL